MSNQEIQRVAEFHVFERNLYQMPQRAPLANGILDPRLVRTQAARTLAVAPPAAAVHMPHMRSRRTGHDRQEGRVPDLQGQARRLRRPLRCVSRRVDATPRG